MDHTTDTITLLKKSGALLEGHFLLSSGRHGDQYFQCALLLSRPERAAAALSGLIAQLKADMSAGKIRIDAVVGPAIGGIIVAYELGRQLGLPALFTERDDSGVMTLRRGFEIKQDMSILVAEDVVTTAKSSGECIKALEEAGAKIAGLACIVDRRAPGLEIDLPFYPACRLEAKTWAPDDCELCREGLPLVKPGSRKIK
ncbi:MAG: orotate phosphoribosyltransferase [Treponema sp.]|nr:orotate phosphoribosyltransferase [Treponema sp.]